MAQIDVVAETADTYRVTVTEGGSSTTHVVTIGAGDVPSSAQDHDPSDVVAASFRFLLDREPKEAIMSRFRLSVISTYFPEYGSALSGYLDP